MVTFIGLRGVTRCENIQLNEGLSPDSPAATGKHAPACPQGLENQRRGWRELWEMDARTKELKNCIQKSLNDQDNLENEHYRLEQLQRLCINTF